jgi:hypothetical protein
VGGPRSREAPTQVGETCLDENGQKAASDLSHLFAFAFVLTCACASSACVLALLHSSNSKALRVPRLSTEEKKQQENCQQLFVDVVCEKSPEPSKLLAVQFPTGLRRCMACVRIDYGSSQVQHHGTDIGSSISMAHDNVIRRFQSHRLPHVLFSL